MRAVAFFRYRFDSDEPQHLHVAWGWAAGLLPYRDFFDNHAPLFHIVTAPIVGWVGERDNVLLYMRAPMLILFAVVLWATYVLAKRLYDGEVARWAVVMLSLLPPFLLKSLEYRTDNLWVALWMIAVVVLTGGELTIARGFAVGVILGFAMATSMKTSLLLITLGIAGVVTIVMKGRRDGARPAAGTAALLAGTAIVPAVVALYFVRKGAWDNLVYCNFVFNEGIGATRTAAAIWGPRLAYVPLMIIALRIAWRKRGARDDRFFWAMATAAFFLTLGGFWILISPRDYLPFLPMISIFAVATIGRRTWIFAALALVFAAFIVKETRGFKNQTREEITMIRQVLELTRPGEYLMDIKGETIFRQRPSYHIFEFITRNQMIRGMIADTVAEDVVAKRCYAAQADGEFWPPQARAFLSANFLDLGRLRAAGQWIKADGSFTIAVPGEYVIVSRNGVVRGPLQLAAGAHRIERANSAERLAVVWAPAIARGLSPFRLQDRDF
ncbi:MAG TPA: glycosyltransferase family 39 protein [Thermoanaerobaculia bacterium]|nr:glycosyltransferase family 39 protein [Thermoanaerobaculia bacterium]